ncbi:hypothetical protein G9A89_015170 [Geosiphon pyriformis]|nr:hypothetical protein G9A89_015170 [Geosiphon pyriformis]
MSFKIGLDQPLAMLPNMVSFDRSLLCLGNYYWSLKVCWIKLAHVKAVFQLVHGFLGVKLVSKDNVKLFCVEFASQVFLKAAFLVELTSFVQLATLKIAKFLVISEFGSSFAAVVLYNVPLDVSAANIKMAFVGKDSVRILPFVNQQETIVSYDRFKAKLVNLLLGCTVFEISNMVFQASVSSVLSEFSPLVAFVSFVVVENSLVFSWLASLESDLAKLSVLVESIVKPIGSMIKVFEQFVNGNLVSSSALGLRVNKVLVHISAFSRAVGKLKRKVITLKTECGFKDINMSGPYVDLSFFNDDMFSNLMSL